MNTKKLKITSEIFTLEMEENKKSVEARLSEMQSVRGDFDNAWLNANSVYNVFMQNDGLIHLPEAKVIIDFLVDEILKSFTGEVEFTSSILSRGEFEQKKLSMLSKIYNQENLKVGVQAERKKAIKNALVYRFGVLFEGYYKTGKNFAFDGLITESVDPRDFFDDESSSQFYDPNGFSGSRDCIRRRWMSPDTFSEMYDRQGFDREKIRLIRQRMGQGASRDQGQQGVIDDQTTGVVAILEHWTPKEVRFSYGGTVFFAAPNPYGKLPFTVYVLDTSQETKYPPSLVETLTPLLMMEDFVVNFIYEMEKISAPYIFADSRTNLIDGKRIEAGVANIVKNETNADIRSMITEVRVGGASPTSYNLLNIIDDRKRNISKIDTRSLRDRPDETLGQAKIKQAVQAKEISNKIKHMMDTAEGYRALLRGRNIINYVFSEEKSVLVQDAQEYYDDVVSQKGKNALLKINPREWKHFDFNVIVKEKSLSNAEKEEARKSMIELFQVGMQFMQSGVYQPQEAKTMKKQLAQLWQEILNTYDLDFEIENKKSGGIKEEIDRILSGENIQGEDPNKIIDMAVRDSANGDSMAKMNAARLVLSQFANATGQNKKAPLPTE